MRESRNLPKNGALSSFPLGQVQEREAFYKARDFSQGGNFVSMMLSESVGFTFAIQKFQTIEPKRLQLMRRGIPFPNKCFAAIG